MTSPPPAEMPFVLPLGTTTPTHGVKDGTVHLCDANKNILSLWMPKAQADAIVAAVNERDSLRDSLQASQVAEQMARDDVRELKRENERLKKQLSDALQRLQDCRDAEAREGWVPWEAGDPLPPAGLYWTAWLDPEYTDTPMGRANHAHDFERWSVIAYLPRPLPNPPPAPDAKGEK